MGVVDSRFIVVPGREWQHARWSLCSKRQGLNVFFEKDAHPGSGVVSLPGLEVRLSASQTALSGLCYDSPSALVRVYPVSLR